MLWLTKNKFLSSRRSSTYLLPFLLILFFVNTNHSYAQSNSIEEGLSLEKSVPLISLTPAESAWLAAHPAIRFAFSADYPPGLIKEMLAELPAELLKELREATLELDRETILLIIDRIEDANAPDTAAGLRELVQNFQMGRIRDLLGKVEGKG